MKTSKVVSGYCHPLFESMHNLHNLNRFDHFLAKLLSRRQIEYIKSNRILNVAKWHNILLQFLQNIDFFSRLYCLIRNYNTSIPVNLYFPKIITIFFCLFKFKKKIKTSTSIDRRSLRYVKIKNFPKAYSIQPGATKLVAMYWEDRKFSPTL